MIRWIIWLVAVVGFADDVKICLSILVQNDEKNIASCLDSVKNFADCICVCDFGSTDRTIDVVEKFLSETKILGFIQQFSQKDRHEILLMKMARKAIERYKFDFEKTYVFLMEPSMVLQMDSGFHKNILGSEPSYLVKEKTDEFSSYQMHLFRADFLWEPSLIYPYWSSNAFRKDAKCKLLTLQKQENLQEVIDRLTKALEREKNNTRYLFDLAKAYHEIKNYETAIEFYQQRIKQGGEKQECWFSKYMIGSCCESLEKWDEALYWYLEAYEESPNQAEPLIKVATHYRLLGQNDLSYIFAKFGSRLPFFQDQLHFSSTSLEPYQFGEELSIVSYYTQFKEDGYKAASDLVLKRGVPYFVRNQTYQNLFFYLQPLPQATYYPIAIDLPFITEGIRYNPMNPSIVKTSDGYSVICRAVNYVQKGAKDFQTYDEHGIYRSRNFLIQYDRNLNFLWQKELVDETFREKVGSSIVQGFEDCRIFQWRGSPWFTCTTTDTNPTGSFQISLCRLGNGEFLGYAPIEFLMPLKGPDPYRCEKNWLPFLEKEELRMIYQYDPLTIYAPNPETGDCKCIYSYLPKQDFSHFRGSAGPVAFDGGYLLLVHEVIFLANSERVYTHRFLFLDRDWIPTRVSKPFIFKHTGVEYCCGMSLDHLGDRMILPIGIEDREACLCVVDCATIRSMLSELPDSEL